MKSCIIEMLYKVLDPHPHVPNLVYYVRDEVINVSEPRKYMSEPLKYDRNLEYTSQNLCNNVYNKSLTNKP